MIIHTALLAGGFTILGAIVGGLISYCSARSTRRHAHFNEAAAQFRSAFVDTLFRLRHAQEDVFRIVTPEVVESQERELIKFMQFANVFVNTEEQKKLKQAWERYVEGRHTMAPGSLDRRPGEIRKVISNIEELMKCAMPK